MTLEGIFIFLKINHINKTSANVMKEKKGEREKIQIKLNMKEETL